MTIITVAGTSGSGKSFVVRKFIDWARKNGRVTEEFIEGRTSPIAYTVSLKGKAPIYVLGSYEVPTGGCDTIHDVADIFDRVKKNHRNCHVIYEGLFVMNMSRGPKLVSEVGKTRLCVLQLDTPLATCIASIDARRAEKGKDKLEAKTNTVDNYRRARNYCSKMRDAGARVFKVTRDEALPKMLELLEVS